MRVNKKLREILGTLLAQMEQAETIEDCLILVENMIESHPDIELHTIDIPDNMNGPDLPPGSYDRAALGNENGFRVQTFQPIVVEENDSLEVTWHFRRV